MPFKEGEQVGSYRIVEQLGRGGMATVFKAYHANLDRYVAIKVLHPAFLEDETFLARFEREAKVVAKLEHPHIIPVYDFAEHEGHPYLVMKYIEGETLKARLKRRPLSPEEGVEIIQAVGEALSYAHKQGILHRDIKPSNVMISEDGEIYLADFGLARIASAGESTLSSDMMIGTPQYISPEQAIGKRNLDEGTDIYSLGVLIYELVVGRVPFSADTPFSIVHDHIYSPLPLPRVVNPKVPEVIERLLLKALAKEREDRFASVDEMVSAFRQAIRGEDLGGVWVDPKTYTPTETPQPMPFSAAKPASDQTPPPTGSSSSVPTGSGSTPLPRKRQWRWWYSIPMGMLLCVCLLLVIGALSDNGDEPFAVLPTNSTLAQVQDELLEETALTAAEARVELNPEDPYAYLDLAGVLIDIGQIDEARGAFEEGAALAGDDGEYYITAGDMLSSREMWVDALGQYRSALLISMDNLTMDTAPKLQKALYFAAAEEDAEEFLFSMDMQNVPAHFGKDSFYAAQSRYNLLVLDDPAQAQVLVDQAFGERSDSPVAQLVQAEIYLTAGLTDDASSILETLKTAEVQSWIQNQARILLSMIE